MGINRDVYVGAGVVAIALGLCVAGGSALAATQPSAPPPASATAAPISATALPTVPPVFDGSFPVTLTLNGTLVGISATAVKGAWLCSARVLSKPLVDAEATKIAALTGQAARSEFATFLESRAHYLNQQATVEFSISTAGSGTVAPITIRVSRDDLVDATTKHLIDQPAVAIGCWLRLTNAAGVTGLAYQVSKSVGSAAPVGTLLQTSAMPYVLVGANVPNQ